MQSLVEVKKHIDSFSRPMGYNTYAWNITKKTALEVWDCYLNNKTFHRPLNYFCKEFYLMITDPELNILISASSSKRLAS